MKVLLDTHALLWFLLDDPALSGTARELIRNPQTEVFVSPASYWESAIKISIGKYRLPEPLAAFMDRELSRNRFDILHWADTTHLDGMPPQPVYDQTRIAVATTTV